jgi:hypothetical protein
VTVYGGEPRGGVPSDLDALIDGYVDLISRISREITGATITTGCRESKLGVVDKRRDVDKTIWYVLCFCESA